VGVGDAWTRIRKLTAESAEELRHPTTPFGRLAVTHILMISGDTLVTIALAGTLFFSISTNAAQGKVVLYLLLTMAPFAVVAPALGPLLDRSRGARRALIMTSSAGRVVLCLLMARHVHSLLLFPEAFGVLVLSKLYLVSKAAVVPATVAREDELVRANSRLALLAAITGFVASLPAVAILKIPFLGAPWVLRVDAVVFLVATVSAVRLPKAPDTFDRPDRRWRGPPVRLPTTRAAASAMAVLRGGMGFLTFLLAFSLRNEHAPAWEFGFVLVASVAGGLIGNLVAPRLRRMLVEEQMLLAALTVVASIAILTAILGGRLLEAALAAAVGFGFAFGKVGFDTLVQRDTPEADQGRAFARFETRFQLVWVVGGLIPVATSLPGRPGALVLGIVAAAAAVSYGLGWRALAAE
jgi:hypothetical protein